MAFVFETIHTEGIAELSYLLGDDSAGIAVIFDPTIDVEKYIDLAREKSLSITHIFETHIHADLVSGSCELGERTGAKIFVSHEGDARYGFRNEALKNGDRFTIGKTVVTACHTPGHTPEHMSYLLAETKYSDDPWGVITGDSLFVDSAGRPDLLGKGQSEKLAEMQFNTLKDFYLNLKDSVIIYPAHGHGSPCGADIGDRLTSTIGREKKYNSFLQFQDVKHFIDYALSTAPAEPTYYKRMKKINARGPELLGHVPTIPGLPPKVFKEAIDEKSATLLDTQSMLSFGGGHISQALNIGRSPMLSIWAGWLIDPEIPLLLVVDEDKNLKNVLTYLATTGFTKFAGYLTGGIKAWDNSGFPIDSVKQISVIDLKNALDQFQVVDVRALSEWKEGHIPGARNIFLPELREKCSELDKSQPVSIYCDSGYRASIATSILLQEGFKSVSNVPGSWQAWQKAGFPIDGKVEK